ncbi:MAG: SDR family oxidoreductase [Candidatus Binataceae bacterium]
MAYFRSSVGDRAAKAAVLNLIRALAIEWAREGIRVNAIETGWLDEPASPANADQEFKKNLLKYLPENRLVAPEDLSGAPLSARPKRAELIPPYDSELLDARGASGPPSFLRIAIFTNWRSRFERATTVLRRFGSRGFV